MEFHEYPYVPPQPVITAQVVPKAEPAALKPAPVIVQPATVNVRSTPLDEFLEHYLARVPISVAEFNTVNSADAITLAKWISKFGAPQIAAPFRFVDFHFDNDGRLREIDAAGVRQRLDQEQFTVAADDAGMLVHLLARADLQRYFAVQEHLVESRETPYSFWPVAVMGDERPRNVLLIFNHGTKRVYLFDAAESWTSLVIGNEERVDHTQFDQLFAQYFADSEYTYVWSRDWRTDARDLQKVYAKQRFDNGCYNPLSLLVACVLLNLHYPSGDPKTALADITLALETHYDLIYYFTLGVYRSVQP